MNLLKRTTIIVLMMAIILSVLTGTSKATIQGKVTADNIRLRSEANTESKVLTLVSINEQVDVVEKEGEWYKIEYKGKTGYIKSEFVELQEDTNLAENVTTQTEKQTTAIETNEQPEETISEEKTVANAEKIYILPLLNSKNIGTIEANAKIEILQAVNGWTYIMTEQFSGWIRTDKLVKKSEEQPQEQNVVEEQTIEKEVNKTGYIKSNSVNFRKEPSKSAEVIGNLTLNTEVTIIAEQGEWYKIKAKNETGYVAKDLVSDKKVEVTSRSENEPRQSAQEQSIQTQEQNTVPTDSTSSDLGQQIANYAQEFVGYPYVYGGSTPSGFDCSGFTSYVYKQFGYSISRSSSAQASNGVAVAKSDLQPGDLVLFKGQNSSSIGHVGIYIGGNQFVHASTAKTGVKISSLSSSGYIARYVTARRII